MTIFGLLLSIISMFSLTIDDINIENQYVFENKQFIYGSYYNSDNDGALLVTNLEENEEIFSLIYDDSLNEYFKYLAIVDGGEYLVVCEKYSLSDGTSVPIFLETEILRLDQFGFIIDSLTLYKKYNGYYNHANCLILYDEENNEVIYDNELNEKNLIISDNYTKTLSLSHRGEAFINGSFVERIYLNKPGFYELTIIEEGRSFTYDITLNPDIFLIGEETNGFYTGNVKIVSSTEVFVNDEIYMVNKVFKEPGIYNITIYGKNDYVYTDSFIIIPTISYCENGESYNFVDGLMVNHPINISSNALSMYLNGEKYNSELIDEVGEYELVIYGINQMQYRLTFYIHPYVSGLENNTDYNTVSFFIYGKALLNGELVSGDVNVIETGDYVLELMFDGEVFEKYYFSVVSSDNVESNGFEFNMNYIFGLFIVIGIVLFYRKK